MRKSKSSIPPFLKGKSIKSNKYSRVDSVNLAKDAEEFTEIKPKNIYSYKKSSLVKWESDGKRFIDFLGTTKWQNCYDNAGWCYKRVTSKIFNKIGDKSIQNLIFNYSIDCDNQTFNREDDELSWNVLFIDKTAIGVYQKYCPIEEWSKLPNK